MSCSRIVYNVYKLYGREEEGHKKRIEGLKRNTHTQLSHVMLKQ